MEYAQGKWDEMIASGAIPDITILNDTLANAIDLATDLTPFIEENDFDLSRIDPTLIESIRNHSENGVQYKGLHPGALRYIVSQQELIYFDENGEANLSTDGWKKVAQLWKDIAEIPGNMWTTGARDALLIDRDTAMAITHASFLIRSPIF